MNYHIAQEGCGRAYLDIDYYTFVRSFGCVCVPILPTEDTEVLGKQLDLVDAVIMTGGLDLDSNLWQAPLHDKVQPSHPHRTQFDLLLYKKIQHMQLPLLAICLGMQVINVAHGGKLIQHLPEHTSAVSVQHGGGGTGVKIHTAKLKANTHLSRWFTDQTIEINSMHHQGVFELGQGLKPAALAADGIIEAFESDSDTFMLAVQWHPEKLVESHVSQTIILEFLKSIV